MSHRLRSRSATLVFIICIVGWSAFAFLSNTFGFMEAVFLGTTLIWVLAYFYEALRQNDSYAPQKIDLILCSFSGNTGHYAEKFTETVKEYGKNRFLYRTYVWRKRCIGCNFCVNYCPINRFSCESGIPKAKETCYLCFGCVNHCPQNAMQMRFWSEYGQPYKSRWPQFIVKK